jgi:hypothetical protein
MLAAAGASVAVVIWLLLPRPSAINAENAAKIQQGMTLDEVEAILGGPPRFDATGRVSYCLTGIPGGRPLTPNLREWTSNEVLVMVWLGPDNRVERRVAIAVRRESADEMFRRWLGCSR